MEGLSYTVAKDDTIIFKVYNIGYAYKQAQVLVPFSGAKTASVEGFTLKCTHAFNQNPHHIGNEGECLHTHTSTTISGGDILAYMLKRDKKVHAGDSVTNMKTYSCESIDNANILTPPLILWRTASREYCILRAGNVIDGDYEGSYSYSDTSSRSVIRTNYRSGYREQTCSYTNIVCSYVGADVTYDYVETDFHSYDSPTYSDFAQKKGYKPVPGGVQATTKKSKVLETADVFFVGVKRSAYLKAKQDLRERLWSYIQYSPAISRQVYFMPVEESFLDDLYETLAIPSTNSVATIIELLGSVRNAKDVSAVFKKIKRCGGIRQTLIKEGSSILKDKKLSTASNLYLTKKYVYDTTRMDVDDFFEKLSARLGQLPFPVQHFRWYNTIDANSKSVHCIRLAYQPYEYSAAELYGFDLPLEATWDVIPYSFVIDWFCSFGDSLESIDKVGALQRIDVVSCTESYRVETNKFHEVNVDDVTVQFYTQSVSYNRYVTNHLPPVYPRSPKLSNPFHHIIDGAALVFARR